MIQVRLVADLSPRKPGFAPGSVNVGFVVVKVALGQVSVRVLPFYRGNIIPLWLCAIRNTEDGDIKISDRLQATEERTSR
jgi:hypothetical protein